MAWDDVLAALREIAAGAVDPWPLVDRVCAAASDAAPDGGQREFDLYLVWIFFTEQTVERGGQEAAEAAMPSAAAEWLAADGNADLEAAYFDRWFAYHGVTRES